ncbi:MULTISPECIES: hypothetical protein [Ensifer]|jgi:hypothetical protein|uniref:Uncharacterized protein n=1 Tax=Ensifer canadensis TaxID=555315 RepID=A0AAW4FSU2_9HYPH|nr:MULTISPECIES: hypothetical protein [Ensifer]MDP9628001.1 hypothetical protein [Ensifer adhaerens]MBD9486806.1 hypothetical protein [Ensifer sp. ENS11]MBM3094391.1 hypothetical protein [Ensifer canadensis]NOV15135.1 hypothetical protein [Ensifer canadensis]UBI76238.1 hypothetical protein J3R84_03525 [Ensifer canadensis]
MRHRLGIHVRTTPVIAADRPAHAIKVLLATSSGIDGMKRAVSGNSSRLDGISDIRYAAAQMPTSTEGQRPFLDKLKIGKHLNFQGLQRHFMLPAGRGML